jgi:hypothetical protein
MTETGSKPRLRVVRSIVVESSHHIDISRELFVKRRAAGKMQRLNGKPAKERFLFDFFLQN